MRYVEDIRCGTVTLRPWTVRSRRRRSLLANHLNRGDKIRICDLTDLSRPCHGNLNRHNSLSNKRLRPSPVAV